MPLNFSHFPLQFITNGTTPDATLAQAEQVLNGGCRWVQLRMKEATEQEVESTARRMKLLCDKYDATLIIDDHVQIAKSVGATGVHLGKNDMHPRDARGLLGNDMIIGGTCNTIEDVLQVKDYVDYIGCGPFRYTTTKKNLAPVLGLEGYQEIIWQMRAGSVTADSTPINIPVVAIGGITVADIPDILRAGPDGIALSGEITRATDMSAKTTEICQVIYEATKES